jgi:hypothetical protein
MALKILDMHHHSVRIGPTEEQQTKAYRFYAEVLGLSIDESRGKIIPGQWLNIPGGRQIHLIAQAGVSKVSGPNPELDPTSPHVALAVPDLQAARKELNRLGVPHYLFGNPEKPGKMQIFICDPEKNVIELFPAGQPG